MFDAVRLFALSALYYAVFAYAAFIVLQQRSTAAVATGPSPFAPAEGSPLPRATVQIAMPALKLMIMLTSMALPSFAGAEWFPLFAEMQLILMYALLFAPPYTQQELYDKVFAPLLVRGGSLALSLQTSDVFSRKVPLLVVRYCINLAIAAMNYTERSHSLDKDAVRDILSGLRFSQRAMQQVRAMTRESDGATFTRIARDSNFPLGLITSQMKRVWKGEQEAVDAAAVSRSLPTSAGGSDSGLNNSPHLTPTPPPLPRLQRERTHTGSGSGKGAGLQNEDFEDFSHGVGHVDRNRGKEPYYRRFF